MIHRPLWRVIKDIIRALSPILAGFKLATIVIGYIGAGSISKWIIEQWYPFTRWLWDNIFSYLNLPKIGQIEKDSLTALLFFLPMGISGTFSLRHAGSEQKGLYIQVISGALGAIFFIILCWDVVHFSLQSITPAIMVEFEQHYQNAITLLNIVYNNSFLGAIAVLFYILMIIIFITKMPQGEKWKRRLWIANIVSAAFFALVLLLPGIYAALISGNALPIISVVLIIFIVVMCIFRSPVILLVTSGASLAFISSAMIYEICLSIISFIESSHK